MTSGPRVLSHRSSFRLPRCVQRGTIRPSIHSPTESLVMPRPGELTLSGLVLCRVHSWRDHHGDSIGDEAPDFTAETTQGPIKFHEWKGTWAVLFSHPKDFTPVCTTELGTVAGLKPEFDKRNTKVIGLSVDPLESHTRWEGDIKDVTGHAVNFPMIADPDKTVANLYDMIHPNASDTATVRSVFIIGPDNKVKLTLTYPASTGRNFQELLRVIDSLQLTAATRWRRRPTGRTGEDVIIVPAVSDEDAKKKFPKGFVAKKPYLRVTPNPLAGEPAGVK